jgi:hypothetical protein
MIRACYDWLVTRWQWPYAAAFAACVVLAFLPLVAFPFTPERLAMALIFLQLPLYMFHQLEEHAEDRFREYINSHIGRGVEVLSKPATFVINSVGVWIVDFVAFYLAVFVNPALGLIAIYLPVVNSLGHVLPALKDRAYNPGLWTSVFGFIPLSWGALFYVSRETRASWKMHLLALAVAIAIHVAIVIHVARKLAAAKKS